jgi:tyrosyl-tRNA synthetase
MIKADIELGGYDQLFNLKIGREMQRIFGQKPQDIMTTQMLYGLDGRKMSTSWGNVINLLDSPEEIYGRIMSMKDELIEDYFVLTSQLSLTRVKEIMKSLRNKEINPKEAKSILAETIIELYYDRESAQAAKENFERVFKERKLPEKIPIFKTKKKRMEILELLTKTGLAKSRSEAKRLILQGGITVIKKEKGSRLKDWQETVKLEEGMVFKGGKRKFVRIKII